mgnify:CR=1 FL=1
MISENMHTPLNFCQTFEDLWVTPPSQTSWHLWFEIFCQDVWGTVISFIGNSEKIKASRDLRRAATKSLYFSMYFCAKFYLTYLFPGFAWNLKFQFEIPLKSSHLLWFRLWTKKCDEIFLLFLNTENEQNIIPIKSILGPKE